jgi:prepilin signal peptidase PulO-like enzyme (type II secretory pathway)
MTYPSWLIALVGIVIGSFLNVLIDRLPEGSSIVSPPSHCPNCKKRIATYDLIPVFSYLLLRGRCRNCEERIPLRVLIVEILTGFLFWAVWMRFGQSWQAILALLYTAILITIAFIDLEHQRVLNVLIYPVIGLALLMIPIFHLESWWTYLAGAALGFGVLFLIAFFAPGAMGMGDVKLVIFLGLINGFPQIAVTLFLAFVLGGLVSGLLLALKKLGRKDTVAFGPYLALGGWIVLLYGEQLLGWWMRMVGA